MLHRVPEQVTKAARAVVLRHPNVIAGTLLRKVVLRQDAPSGQASNGFETMGGMGVLDTEDEAQIDYVAIGDVGVVLTGQQTAAMMTMLGDIPDMPAGNETFDALVEFTDDAQSDSETIKQHDLIIIFPDAGLSGARVAFEVLPSPAPILVAPYVRCRHTLAKRDDLLFIPSLQA